MAKNGAHVHAVDLTKAGVEGTKAIARFYGLDIQAEQMDCEKLAFGDEIFDYVFSWGVLHHTHDTQAAFRQVRRVLKPNGERLMAHAQRMIALNDEVWGAMSAPAYEGEVRLGVPHDIVGTYLPPILRRFDKAWPRVRVSLKCTTTPNLLELLRQGSIDLTLTTEERCGRNGETLIEDQLVWIGAINGLAHRRNPLPVSIGDEKCEFRGSVLKALAGAGLDWRPVCEVSSMEPLLASMEADLAVGPMLRRSTPACPSSRFDCR
jgi:DNA-binding transcriptional LysR family regulator